MSNKFCVMCGTTLRENHRFCPECGSPIVKEEAVVEAAVMEEGVVQSAQQPVPQPMPQPIQPTEYTFGKDSKYQPISTWGYIGIFLLMGIPCVGFIVMIVWAFGGCRKVNKRNLSRAALIMTVISLIFSFIIGSVINKAITDAIESSALGVFFQDEDDANAGNSEKTQEQAEMEALLSIMNILMSQEGDASEEGSTELNLDGMNELLGVEGMDELLGSESMDEILGAESMDELLGMEGMDELLGEEGMDELMGSEDMQELMVMMAMLEGLSGEDGEMDLSGLFSLDMGNESGEQEAEAGWPADLRPYPDGEKQTATENSAVFAGTTKEEVIAYIEELKADGFAYLDFSEGGKTEEEMLADNAWQGTNGNLNVSLAYAGGKVTIEYTTP